MKTHFLVFMLFFAFLVQAQEQKILTIEQCYAAAEEHYPLTKKRELIARSSEYTIANISKGYLPQLSGMNQLSWQSDVTSVPVTLPGVDIPEQDKLQYKSYTDVSQLLYDGGMIRQKKKNEIARSNVEMQTLEVELYRLKQRINDLYFGLLIVAEQQKQNELLKEDIRIGLKVVEAQIANGTAFRSNADLLKAELLKAEQQAIALKNNRKTYLQMLGLFIGSNPDENTLLQRPQAPMANGSMQRPELKLFDFRKESLEAQKKLIGIRDIPKLSLFAQSGFGNPGLNMFEEGLQNYFIGGARLTWSLSYTKKKEKAILDFSKQQTEADRETFLFNTTQELQQQNAEINRLQEYIAVDANIITLRNNVKKATLAQLQNGVADTNDYLREVNEENTALQNKSTHETELLLAQYREKITRGN